MSEYDVEAVDRLPFATPEKSDRYRTVPIGLSCRRRLSCVITTRLERVDRGLRDNSSGCDSIARRDRRPPSSPPPPPTCAPSGPRGSGTTARCGTVAIRAFARTGNLSAPGVPAAAILTAVTVAVVGTNRRAARQLSAMRWASSARPRWPRHHRSAGRLPRPPPSGRSCVPERRGRAAIRAGVARNGPWGAPPRGPATPVADRAGVRGRAGQQGGGRPGGVRGGDGRASGGRRFVELRLDGLVDEPAPGPAAVDHRRAGRGRGGGHVGVDAGERDALVAGEDGRAQPGCRKSTIGRIWQAFELKPHRADGFKLSNDPLFVEKVYDVVGLYLDPPEAAVVLCVDEKSQVQALARSQPAFPMMPGMPEKRTHDYVRHGTTSLFAAFNTADGTVISTPAPAAPRDRVQASSWPRSTPRCPPTSTCTWSATTTAPTRPRRSRRGWPPTPGSTCTSPRPTPVLDQPGRAVLRLRHRPTCSSAATTAASKPSKPTSAPGSRPGTTTPKPFVWTKTADQILDLTRTTSSTNQRRRTLVALHPIA